MGKIVLVTRLAARDLRRHQGQAVLLLLAITAATVTLTLGLALHGVTSHPYQQTRAATNGPDVVAQLGGPAAGPHGPGQVSASPPYPNLCNTGCSLNFPPGPQFQGNDIGLAWVTQPDARALAQSAGPPSYVLNLTLNDPAAAPAFAGKYGSNSIGFHPAGNAQ